LHDVFINGEIYRKFAQIFLAPGQVDC